MKSLGLGLIGLGRHGQRYARHLLEGIPHCQLMAICRRDSAKGQVFATEHGLQFYQDHHDLIADPHIQAILLVTPPAEAIPIALEVIRQNKPLLIEKPLGCTSLDAQQVVKEAARIKTPLMVAHTLRYEDTIIQLKNHGAEIGNWQYLVLTNRLEAPSDHNSQHSPHRQGALLEIGIHQLDMVRFLTGQEVRQVDCEMERHHPEGPDVRAWVSLKTESGLPCLLDISRLSKSRVTRAEIIGETGQLIADWTSRSLIHVKEDGASISLPITSTKPTIPKVISDFVHAIQTGTPMPITGLDGLRAVEMADACYESAKTQSIVALKKH